MPKRVEYIHTVAVSVSINPKKYIDRLTVTTVMLIMMFTIFK